MIKQITELPRYIVCSRVTKRPVFEFVSNDIRPNDSMAVFAFADDYSFGILQSGIHWAWFTAKCSTLTERFRYTSDTVFDTFAWPQFAEVGTSRCDVPAGASQVFGQRNLEKPVRRGLESAGSRRRSAASLPAVEKIRAVAVAARALRNLRHEIMDANDWSLRELYKSLETHGENRLRTAHATLDTAVRAAYA